MTITIILLMSDIFIIIWQRIEILCPKTRAKKVCNAGLVTYPLSRFVARLKMTENSNANGAFVATGVCQLHTLCNGYVASVFHSAIRNLWF